MSSIGALITEKNQQTEEFKQQKAAERQELSEMAAAAIRAATGQPEAYLRYLDVQADNPGFSASNILLALQQNGAVTVFNTVNGWNKLGHSVTSGETGFKVRVSDPYVKNGKTHRGYKVGRAFDISQTTGNRAVGKVVLADETPEMQLALRALLYKSPVKISTVKDGDLDAYYDPKNQLIHVSETLTDSQTLYALSREIFHARIHDHGRYGGYNREELALDAESVAYMLCRSLGVPCRQPDASRVAALYDGLEPQDARSILDGIQSGFRDLHDAVQKELAPQQQERRRGYSQPEK